MSEDEWTAGIRRRLGLVAELHHCHVVYDDDKDDGWAWICGRGGCSEGGYRYPSQPDAFADAFAHACSFLPEPLPEEPFTELQWALFEVFCDNAARQRAADEAALRGHMGAVMEQVNGYLAGVLPDGMRFEWRADGGK